MPSVLETPVDVNDAAAEVTEAPVEESAAR